MDQQTPLHEHHLRAGARMAPFAGWEMPIQYRGILDEHHATRRVGSLFDISHMGELEVSGPGALAALERLVTSSLTPLAVGQCRYGYLLNPAGGVLDDLIVYRRAEERFMLVVNAANTQADAGWIRSHLPTTTRFRDITAHTAKIDIQGPKVRAELETALGAAIPELKYFRFTGWSLLGTEVLLSRTGYTGEWGYEVYLPAEAAGSIWDFLLERTSLQPAGLGARDTLRLEMGYPLYGHELSVEASPVAAARGMHIDRNKEFIGREAVLKDLERGCPRVLAGLRLETRSSARPGDHVLVGDSDIGTVTSGAFSPSVGVAIALAMIDTAFSEPGQELSIEVRGRRLAARVVALPFYTQGTVRG